METIDKKYIGICLKGLEETCAEICKGKKIAECRVSFSELAEYGCFSRVYLLEGEFKFTDIDDLTEKTKFNSDKTKFKVVCNRIGEHDFNSAGVASKVSRKFNLNFDNEKIFFVDIINDKCFYGEMIYSDLGKRDYRLKLNPETLDPCLAYCSLYLLGAGKNDLVADLYCRDGIVLVEAAKLGCECFGFMNNIRNARINSKAGRVNIKFEEQNLNNLIEKIKKNSKRKLVCSYILSESKNKSWNYVLRQYKDLFETMAFADKMCLIARRKDILKFVNGFKLKKELFVEKGDDSFFIYVFDKN